MARKTNPTAGVRPQRRSAIHRKHLPMLRNLAIESLGPKKAALIDDDDLLRKVYVITHKVTDLDEVLRVWLKKEFGLFPFTLDDVICNLRGDSGAGIEKAMYDLEKEGHAYIVGIGGGENDEHPTGGTSATVLSMNLPGTTEENIAHVKQVIRGWGVPEEELDQAYARLLQFIGVANLWDSTPTAHPHSLANMWKNYGYSVVCRMVPEMQVDGWKITFGNFGHKQLMYLLWWTDVIGKRIVGIEHTHPDKELLDILDGEIADWAVNAREKYLDRRSGEIKSRCRFRLVKLSDRKPITLGNLLEALPKKKKGGYNHWRERSFLNGFREYLRRLALTDDWVAPKHEIHKGMDRPQYDASRGECPYGFATIALMLMRSEIDESLPKALRLPPGSVARKFIHDMLRVHVHRMWLEEVGGVEAKKAEVVEIKGYSVKEVRAAVLHHSSPFALKKLRKNHQLDSDVVLAICDAGFRGFLPSHGCWGYNSEEIHYYMLWLQAYVEQTELQVRGFEVPHSDDWKKRQFVLTRNSKIDPSINPSACWYSPKFGPNRKRGGLYGGTWKHDETPDTMIPVSTLSLLMQVVLHAVCTDNSAMYLEYMFQKLVDVVKESGVEALEPTLEKFIKNFEKGARKKKAEEAEEATKAN